MEEEATDHCIIKDIQISLKYINQLAIMNLINVQLKKSLTLMIIAYTILVIY